MGKARGGAKSGTRQVFNAQQSSLEGCIKLFRYQMSRGYYLLHEHPALATRWKVSCVEALGRSPIVGSVVAHMCAFGMASVGGEGKMGPVLKPTVS